MDRVLITGGAGFIGAKIVEELYKAGDYVVVYDCFSNYVPQSQSYYSQYLAERLKRIKDKAELVRGDVRYKSHLFHTLKEHKIEKIIHLAALPIASASNVYSEEALDINLNGVVNVLEVMRKIGSINRIIYASSSMIYGDFQYTPADEQHPTNPLGVYGAAKLAGELLTRAHGTQFGIEYTIIRPSAVYGPTDANRRVSQIFVENALKGEKLVLEDGGQSKLDFTHVEDTAHGFVLALKSPKAKNETFNITRGEGRSIKEFAEILGDMVPGLETIVKPAKMKRPERGALDIKKARKL